MPRTITRPWTGSSLGPRHLAHVHVEVRPDLLDVLQILERLEQFEEGIALFAANLNGVFRHHGELGFHDLNAFAFQALLNDVEVAGSGRDEEAILLTSDVVA